MPQEWNDTIPIYKQLEMRIVSWILNGTYPEGEALPSVRKLSIEMQINHLTVAKAFQELVDNAIIEKRRGLGMFVAVGAVEKLGQMEKQKFFEQELPALVSRMQALGISSEELTKAIHQFGEKE